MLYWENMLEICYKWYLLLVKNLLLKLRLQIAYFVYQPYIQNMKISYFKFITFSLCLFVADKKSV